MNSLHTSALNPDLFKSYLPATPNLCPYCNHPLDSGTHQQIEDRPEGPVMTCRVPMIIHHPQACGVITGVTF